MDYIKRNYSNLLSLMDALQYKGVIDCSTEPNYPAADAGHVYIVSVAGKIGGASGIVVALGDMMLCKVDGTATGDQATVGSNWNIVEKNINLANIIISGGTINNTVIGSTTPATGTFSFLKSKGPAIITTGFVGTASRETTNLTFTSVDDAILAGYDAANPVLGTTVVLSANTMIILSWTSSTVAIVDVSGTIAAAIPTSVQAPIAFNVDSSGVLKWALFAGGGMAVVGHIRQTGTGNSVFLGEGAGVNDDLTNNYNVFVGRNAGHLNTSGSYNVAVGDNAFGDNTTGSYNVAVGEDALAYNTIGDSNVAVGECALYSNTGGYNVAVGESALFYLEGDYYDNVALGWCAGELQADGWTDLTATSESVYIGSGAMGFNNFDVNSIVIGFLAKGIGANTVVLGNDDIVTTLLKGKVGIRKKSPVTDLDIAGSIQVSSDVALSLGGYVRTFAEATGTPAGTTTFFDIAIDVPAGCKLLGCQLRVDTALTAGETWSAAYVTGSTTVLASAGQAVAKNIKVNKIHVDEITTDVTKVRITRDAGSFTDATGVIRAIVYYETFSAMGDAA